MGVISMREFNANISAAFARVDGGEDLVVTRKGKQPIRLSPADLKDDEEERARDLARLRELMKMGSGPVGPATYEERTGLDRLL
ncbi:MAG: type II toxin-antitoxin system Phd/YefM family antitoxin [Proteobacteria bacterium]|nr:type II toxin-antitoxin system Phd/YefM family antitoxin [Pseudomonadota bacterium]